MKKGLLCLLMLAALIVFPLAGCGGGDSSKVEMRDYVTMEDETVSIPVEPQRVVALTGVGDLVAMGIKPIAAINFFKGEGFETAFAGVVELENSSPFDVEEIMDYDPDLILVSNRMAADNRAKLRMIAPVVPLDNDSNDPEERLDIVADIFQISAKADEIIDSLNAKITAAKQRLTTAGVDTKTVHVYDYFNAGLGVFEGPWASFNTIMYEFLGLKMTTALSTLLEGSFYLPVDLEMLDELGGDYYFVLDNTDDLTTKAGTIPADLANNALWKATNAVKAGHMSAFNAGFMAQNNAIYLETQIDFITDVLVAAFSA